MDEGRNPRQWPHAGRPPFLFEIMDIKGKVHLFFEQSGTFKNEFIKLGIHAFDYDIQNNFGQTDHVVDLFAEIEKAYGGGNQEFGIQSLSMI